MGSKISTIDNTVSSTKKMVDTHTAEITELKKVVNSQKKQIDDMRKNMDTLTKQTTADLT